MSCLRMNSFLSKTVKMEMNDGIFICPSCEKYSSNNGNEFLYHLDEKHTNYDTIQCMYCNKIVNKNFFVQHTKFHFRNDITSKQKCKVCEEDLSIACLDNIFDHIMHFHRDFSACINCDEQFSSEVNLFNHIKQNLSRLYHCQVNNCKMKTQSYHEILDHIKSKNHLDFNLENMMICNPMKIELCYDTLCSSNVCQSSIQVPIQSNDFLYNIAKAEKIYKTDKIALNRKMIEEIYQLIFLKEDFIRSNFLQFNDLDLMNKLLSVEKHKIGKPSSKDFKVYFCMSCTYLSCHSFNDVKKHILSQHCYVHHTDIPANMTFIIHKFQEQLTPIVKVNLNPFQSKRGIEKQKKNDDYYTMGIPYSRTAFEIVYSDESESFKKELKEKLDELEKCSIKVAKKERPKIFYCEICKFESNHSIVDVKRHIMRRHCSIVDTFIPDFCKLTKVDNQWNLLSDEAILQSFNNGKSKVNVKQNNIRKQTFINNFYDQEMVALRNIRDRKRKYRNF